MSGIYIHIPFCKQACHYCDFHFSTSLQYVDEMTDAICKEIILKKDRITDQVGSIYFGGGTPSILPQKAFEKIFNTLTTHFSIAADAEITIETNPDDLDAKKIAGLRKLPVNRFSIGIQSFFEDDLMMMNRAHNAEEAKRSLALATQHFENISIDLIYGIPGMSNERWQQNIETALSFGIPHISSYALTVEPRTALKKLIEIGKIAAPNDETASGHFNILTERLQKAGFVHYELSNFGKENYFSRNNSAYWLGKKYLGIGPSAHSYNGISRSWNVANNTIYLKSILENKLPSEIEILSVTDKYNEYVMTGLRTIWGVSLEKIQQEFGTIYVNYLQIQVQKFLDDKLVMIEDAILKPSAKGKFLTDGIAADLFFIDSE